MKIIINAKEFETSYPNLSFQDILGLAFPNKSEVEQIIHTVVYRKGIIEKPEGIMNPSESVPVKEGMIFTVADCSNG